MKKLYLHVGHGKTGTSYLQSVLARLREPLLEHGINYPTHNSLEDARQGRITSGNGIRLMDAVKANQISPPWFNLASNVIFSSEFLFDFLLPNPNRAMFLDYLEKTGIDQVNILLFIRNPIDQVSSGYQQFIKRGGGDATIDEYARDFKMPGRVVKFLENYAEAENITLTIKNYSAHQDDLYPILLNFLDVEELDIEIDNARVNRSLSYAELTLQRAFNKVLGKSGQLIADPLCNFAPEVDTEKLYPSLAIQEKIISQNRAWMETVNAHVDRAEEYDLSATKEMAVSDADKVYFTPGQIEVLAVSLASEIKRLRQRLEALEQKPQK